jgi:hypothetical protein
MDGAPIGSAPTGSFMLILMNKPSAFAFLPNIHDFREDNARQALLDFGAVFGGSINPHKCYE